jgi:hypothetical protein
MTMTISNSTVDIKKPKTVSGLRAKEVIHSATGALTSKAAQAKSIVVDGQKLVFAERAAHIITLGPKDAAELLKRNINNRDIRPQNLNKIITDIQNGDYLFNGSSIVLSNKGVVLDAQHRLLAVVESGMSIVTVIVTGVEGAAQKDMDSGKIRTLKENLTRDGELYPGHLAAVLFGLQSWERGERSTDASKGLTTNSTCMAFLAEHPEVRDLTRESSRVAALVQGLSGKQVAQLMWAFDKHSAADREDFFEKLITGAGLLANNPILALRNFLQNESTSNAKVTPAYRTGLTCRAWNMYRAGDTGKLSYKPGGSKPESFPEPR